MHSERSLEVGDATVALQPTIPSLVPPAPTSEETPESVTPAPADGGPRNRALLFAVAGPRQGSVFPIRGAELHVGRDGGAQLNLSDAAVSSLHARVSLGEGGATIEDLSSRNGTYVNGEPIDGPVRLVDGDHLRMGDTILRFSMLDELEEQALTGLFELTVRDPLTHTYNRRYLDTHLESELGYAERQQAPLALLLVDIDHFKRINDTYGHRMGDVVLKLVALSIQRLIRPYDVLCRFGGEEFVVVARNTSLRNAEILAERIRRRVEDMPLELDHERVFVTVSVGVISVEPALSSSDSETLMEAVDRALYRAKQSGRNRVVTSVPEGSRAPSRQPNPETMPPASEQRTRSEPRLFAPEHRSPPLPRVP